MSSDLESGSSRSISDRHDLEDRVATLVSIRRLVQARSEVQVGLMQEPDNTRLLYFSGFIDYLEQRYDAARETVAQLLRLQPDDYPGRTLLAHLQEAANQLPEAESTWISLLHDYPENSDLLGHYGELMLRTFHIDKARQLAQLGLRLEPAHENCLFVATLCDMIDGRSLGLSSNFVELVRRHPERVRTGLALVMALIDQRRHRDALRVAQGLLRAQPDSPQLVELVQELRRTTHWSMLPLYPVQRWGWTAAIGMWAAIAFGLPLLAPSLPDGVAGALGLGWIVYVVYSWVWPALAKRVLD